MTAHTLAAARSWAVLTTKSSGAVVCFNTYRDQIEADRVVAQLAKVGCPARVERARATDVPGRERRA